MRNSALRLFVCVFILAMTCPAGAAVVTILDDYDVTGDLHDVVHLGDRTYTDFYRDDPQGTSWEFQFAFDAMGMPLPEVGEQFTLYISHYKATPNRGYFDYVFLNSTCIGYLAEYEMHWYDEAFAGSNDLFIEGTNTLSIYSGQSSQAGEDPSNWDDFEFTNLLIVYDAVTTIPVPEAIVLGTLGTGLVGWLRRRRAL